MTLRSKATLLGIGTAGALGTYLYKKPKLRKKLWKSHSAAEAAAMIGTEMQKDASILAEDVKERASHNRMTNFLSRSKRTLGKRFGSMKREARHEARTAKTAAKHAKNVAEVEAEHMKDMAKDEAEHLLTEQEQRSMAA